MSQIEQKTAQTLLQEPMVVRVGHRTYKAPQPTYGTLVKVSEIIATNEKELILDSQDITPGILRFAKDSTYVADALSVLILGAKRLKWCLKNVLLDILFRITHGTLKSPRKYLAEEIMCECTNEQLNDLFGELVGAMNVKDFFAVITFLADVTITRPTKVRKTTASGLE